MPSNFIFDMSLHTVVEKSIEHESTLKLIQPSIREESDQKKVVADSPPQEPQGAE
jgi:hypothetical protein